MTSCASLAASAERAPAGPDIHVWKRAGFWVAFTLAALAMPPLMVPLPPLLDWPNHYARMWLLAGGMDHPPLNAVYAVDWAQTVTNIGLDLLAATAGRVVGMGVLGPLCVTAAVLLPVAGSVLLSRAVWGTWRWHQIGFSLFAWCATLGAGFITFQIGLGLALLLAAADRRIAGRTMAVATVIRGLAVAMIFTVHAFGALFYLALVAGLAVGPHRAELASIAAIRRTLRRVIVVIAPALVPTALIMLCAPSLPGSYEHVLNLPWQENFTPQTKLITLLSAFTTYSLTFDVLLLVVAWLVIRLTVPGTVWRWHAGLASAAIGFAVLSLAFPGVIRGTCFLDWRFPIMAVLTTLAAAWPEGGTARAQHMAMALLVCLSLVRTGWVGSIWLLRETDAQAVERALAVVQPGDSVLPVDGTLEGDAPFKIGEKLAVGLSTYWHRASLAVPLRQAFVPTLFSAPGKQPLRVLSPWREMSVPEGIAAPPRALGQTSDHTTNERNSADYKPYVTDWRHRFRYVLMFGANPASRAVLESVGGLTVVTDAGYAVLYRNPAIAK